MAEGSLSVPKGKNSGKIKVFIHVFKNILPYFENKTLYLIDMIQIKMTTKKIKKKKLFIQKLIYKEQDL